MLVSVGAWNLDGKLGNPDNRDSILDGIEELDTDITFLGEAYSHTHSNRVPDYKNVGLELGRTAICVPYQNETPHPSDEQYMMALVRGMPGFRAINLQTMRLATRNAIDVTLFTENNTEAHVFGVHYDDRSEEVRRSMSQALLEACNPRFTRAVALGRFNSMHSYSFAAQLLGNSVVGTVAEYLPHRRLRSLAGRLHQMAYGTALHDLEKEAFNPDATSEILHDLYKSADPYDRATRGITQLDHIMVGQPKHGGIEYVPDSFRVYDFDGHKNKAISAEVIIHEDEKAR